MENLKASSPGQTRYPHPSPGLLDGCKKAPQHQNGGQRPKSPKGRRSQRRDRPCWHHQPQSQPRKPKGSTVSSRASAYMLGNKEGESNELHLILFLFSAEERKWLLLCKTHSCPACSRCSLQACSPAPPAAWPHQTLPCCTHSSFRPETWPSEPEALVELLPLKHPRGAGLVGSGSSRAARDAGPTMSVACSAWLHVGVTHPPIPLSCKTLDMRA